MPPKPVPSTRARSYGIAKGHRLRSLDHRDTNRIVEVVGCSDDGEQYDVRNIVSGRRASLSYKSIVKSWEIVGVPGDDLRHCPHCGGSL